MKEFQNLSPEAELVLVKRIARKELRALRIVMYEATIVSIVVFGVLGAYFFLGMFSFNGVLALSVATAGYAVIGRWRFLRHTKKCESALERAKKLSNICRRR